MRRVEGVIGALMDPAATYKYSGADTTGCIDVTKTVLVTFDSDGGRTVLKDVGATAIKHKNGRTLAGFSTSLEADVATLERDDDELPPRTRLALQFRVVQKRGLAEMLRAL